MRPYNIQIEYSAVEADKVKIIEAPCPHFSWSLSGEFCREESLEITLQVIRAGQAVWQRNYAAQIFYSADYDGPNLLPGIVYTFSVTCRTEGVPSSVSREFCLGSISSWTADWLYAPQIEDGQVISYYKDFYISDDVADACLFVGTMGFHCVYINGEALTDAPMNPAFCEYDKRVYYQVFPINGEKIVHGKNRIMISVADGWRTPKNCCYDLTGRIPDFTGTVQTTAMIWLYRADDTVEKFCTDLSWKWFRGAIRTSNIFEGEIFDASYRVPEEMLPSGSDCIAESALVHAGCSDISVCPQTIRPVAQQERYAPVCMWPMGSRRWIVDFGQNIAGACRLKIPSGMVSGTHITLRYAETLDEDGKLFTAPLRGAKSTDLYISAEGKDLDEWQPSFTYHGFRYAEVIGYPDELLREDILAIRYYTDCYSDNYFSCGSPILNQIYKCCIETEKSNIQGILTDCPQRDERMGWLNDATVRFEAVPYLFDTGDLFVKVARDCQDTQDGEGAIADTAPFAFGLRPADPVCSSFLLTGWETYLHQGNTKVMREQYDHYAKWTKYLLFRSENYIVDYSWYGDWAAPAYACRDAEDARSEETPGNLMSTGYLYFNAVLLAQMAAVLEKRDEQVFFTELAEKVRLAFLTKWSDGTGKVGTGSEGCQSFALWLNILPTHLRQKAADILHQDLVSRNYQFTTGNLCTRYLLDVLTEYGYIEDAWKLLQREEYPSFGYMIEHQATTIWERFELKKNPTMNSHNHPMYGSVSCWYYRYLAGLRPLEKGWEFFSFAPCVPEQLGYVQASVQTRFGQIEMKWEKEYDHLHVYLFVPNGTTADVVLPWEEKSVCKSGMYHWMSDWHEGKEEPLSNQKRRR